MLCCVRLVYFMCFMTSAAIPADPWLMADAKRFDGAKVSVHVASHTNAFPCLKGKMAAIATIQTYMFQNRVKTGHVQYPVVTWLMPVC